MKYYIILGVNCLLLVYLISFLIDHSFLPNGIVPKIRNIIFILLLITVSYNLVTIYVLKKNTQENGLVYASAGIIQKNVAGFRQFIQPFQKELLVYTLIAVGLAAAGLLLVGIPGQLLLDLPAKTGLVSTIKGDNKWPAAILLSVLWPLCLPGGILVKNYLLQHGYHPVSSITVVISLLLGIPFMTGLVYALFNQ
jgi:hypothetical protein